MPDYCYYIIGVCLAIFLMALIIAINSKPSKKKEDCKCEAKEETKIETSTEEKVEKEEKTEQTAENQPEETKVVEETEQVEKQQREEKQPQKEAKKEEESKKEETEVSKKDKPNRYRVTYDKEQGNWVVKMDGANRASRRCATKEEALKVAKELAEKKDASLSVHKKDGKFQKKSNI